MANNFNCKKCGAEDIKSFQMLHEQQTSPGSFGGLVSGAGVGIGSNGIGAVGGGGAFTTDGTDQSPWVYRGGLGYVMSKTKSLELSVRYDIEGRSSDFTNQTGSLNLRMPF